MGMRYEDFWFNYSLRELMNAIEGFFQREDRISHEAWEQTRWLGTVSVNIHRRTPINSRKLLPLPWDNEGKVDMDEIAELRKQIEEDNKKLWQAEQ